MEHIKKFKYYYIYAAFVVLLALLAAVGFIVDSNIADLETAGKPYTLVENVTFRSELDENGKPIPETVESSLVYQSLYIYLNTFDKKYADYLDEMKKFEEGTVAKAPKEVVYNGNAPMSTAITTAMLNRFNGEATEYDEWLLTDGIDLFNSLSCFLYNQKQVSFFSLFQFLILMAGAIAMLIIIAKSEGEYNVGFAPFFGSNAAWFTVSLICLILAIPAALYALFGEAYTWSTILFLGIVFASTVLSAFGQFALRKQGVGKWLRFVIPTVGSYLFNLIFILAGSFNATGFGTIEALTMIYPELLVYAILFVAPLWVNMAYLMSGSVMATALPYASLGFTFFLFPAVIQTISTEIYATILVFVALVVLILATLAMIIALLVKLGKKLPIPADLVCEMYEEGAPEITLPENYIKAAKEKKDQKIAKKAKKNDFAFLDEPEKTEIKK